MFVWLFGFCCCVRDKYFLNCCAAPVVLHIYSLFSPAANEMGLFVVPIYQQKTYQYTTNNTIQRIYPIQTEKQDIGTHSNRPLNFFIKKILNFENSFCLLLFDFAASWEIKWLSRRERKIHERWRCFRPLFFSFYFRGPLRRFWRCARRDEKF